MAEDNNELSEPQKDMIFISNMCPDCGQVGFFKGPEGGCSTNIKCKHCGSEFNVCAPFFAERIGNPKAVEMVRRFAAADETLSEGGR